MGRRFYLSDRILHKTGALRPRAGGVQRGFQVGEELAHDGGEALVPGVHERRGGALRNGDPTRVGLQENSEDSTPDSRDRTRN